MKRGDRNEEILKLEKSPMVGHPHKFDHLSKLNYLHCPEFHLVRCVIGKLRFSKLTTSLSYWFGQ